LIAISEEGNGVVLVRRKLSEHSFPEKLQGALDFVTLQQSINKSRSSQVIFEHTEYTPKADFWSLI
jgi:hypothetical protein